MNADCVTALDAAWDAVGDACGQLIQHTGHDKPTGRDAYARKITSVVDTIDEDDPVAAVGLRWSARWGCRPAVFLHEQTSYEFLVPDLLSDRTDWIDDTRGSTIGFWIPREFLDNTTHTGHRNNSAENIRFKNAKPKSIKFDSYREAFHWLGERVIETGADSWKVSLHS